jgi:hypothetical protein
MTITLSTHLNSQITSNPENDISNEFSEIIADLKKNTLHPSEKCNTYLLQKLEVMSKNQYDKTVPGIRK